MPSSPTTCKGKMNEAVANTGEEPKTHPSEDICSSKDHDRSCFSLMGWADPANVESWLNMKNVFKVDCQALGANISGSQTRAMVVTTKVGEEGIETKHNFVRKIGVHDKGLGRCREAVFYLEFNPPENSTEKAILENARNSALKELRQFIPKCHFAHFDNTHEIKEKMAIVIERVDGVDSGWFFGRHSPLNWSFPHEDEMDKVLAPWTKHGIDTRRVCLTTARIAACIHGPFWNQVDEKLMNDHKFEHASRRDLFERVFDSKVTGDEEPPSYFTESLNRVKVLWEKEKERLAEFIKNHDEQFEKRVNASTNSSNSENATAANEPSSPSSENPPASPHLSSLMNKSSTTSPSRGALAPLTDAERRPFGFSQLVVDCLEASFEKTTWKNYLAELRAHPGTLVHGDFHPGNMIVATVPEDQTDNNSNNKQQAEDDVKLFLVDFEMFGFGSGPQELGQYMISHARPENRKQLEEEVVGNYIRHLQEDFGVAKSDEEVAWIKKEYKNGGAGRWFWFLPLLMGMSQDKNFKKYFHDQVEMFLIDHGINASNAPMVRV